MNFGDLKKEIRQEHEKVLREWNRVLPTNELFLSRWEKAEMLGAEEGSSIYDSAVVFGDVQIGKNVWVGPWVILDGSGGGVTIGDWSGIGAGSCIFTHNSIKRTLSAGKYPVTHAPVVIGERCNIGSMSFIGMGVEIGRCSVVSPNSFVLKSFPPCSIIAGSPAKQIGIVHVSEDDEIELEFFHKTGKEQLEGYRREIPCQKEEFEDDSHCKTLD